MSKIVREVLEKSRKNLIFGHKIAYKKKLGFFFKKPASSLFIIYECLTSCQISEKSLERLTGKTLLRTTNQPTNCNIVNDGLNVRKRKQRNKEKKKKKREENKRK